MSADSIYSGDWNSCLTGSQMNAWNLEDDITRIGSRAEDYLSGVWRTETRALDTGSRWKMKSDEETSDPFRQFQTPPPNRTSPTPLADLYSLSIDQAVVNSESWGEATHSDDSESSVDEENYSQSINEVECMPQDLFSFSQMEPKKSTKSLQETSSQETTARSKAAPKKNKAVKNTESSLTEDDQETPKLLDEATQTGAERQVKRPLLSLSVGMSICGVGLVFGAQIMHNTAVVNPGKSLIIAGLFGMFVSFVLQTIKRIGRRRTA